MKIKSTIKALLRCGSAATIAAVLSATLTACTSDVDNVFGESAAKRVAEKQSSYIKLLESQQHGWALDFYPSDRSSGGVVYTAHFKDGAVTMACEQPISNSVIGKDYNVGDIVSSYYTVDTETSILLSFDTYNGIFHYWSQPFPGHAKGYDSDYEFIFLSANADDVVLTGKKHGNLLRMYPLQMSITDYVKQVNTMHTTLSATARKRAVADGKVYPITMANSVLTYIDGNQNKTMAFIHTPEGIRFYEPVTLGGITTNLLTYNADTQELRSPDNRLVLPPPNTIEKFAGTQDQWYFGFSVTGSGSRWTPAYTDMCDELADIIAANYSKIHAPNWGAEVLNEIYLGGNLLNAGTDPHRTVLGWHTRLGYGSGTHEYFGYAININVTGDANELIDIQAVEPANGYDDHKYCQTFVDFIAGNAPYSIVFDNDQNPTEATLTSKKDATKWFKVKLKK